MRTWIDISYLLVVLAGCGKVAGSHNTTKTDAPSVTDDATVASDTSGGIDAIIPDNIIVTGIVQTVIGTNVQPCIRCEVDFFAANGTSEIARGQPDASGTYVTILMSNGIPITLSHLTILADSALGVLDTSFFLAAPLVSDRRIDVKLFDRSAIEMLEQRAGIPPTIPARFMIVHVFNSAGAPLAGATVSVVPVGASIIYTDGAGNPVPSTQRTSTAADGIVYLFNPPNPWTVSAIAPGLTFTPRNASSGPAAVIVELAPAP